MVTLVKEKTREHIYWGKMARRYDAATNYVIGQNAQREVGEWLSGQFEATDNVLEIGCGPGSFSLIIADRVRYLTATDGSPEMLELARRRLRTLDNVAILMEDCYHTSFADGSFDSVFLSNVIHIIRHPIDVVRECRRVLKDDGYIVMADVTSSGMKVRSKITMGVRYLIKFGLPPKEYRVMGPDDISGLVEQGGFLIEELKIIEKETNIVCLKGRKRR